MDRIASDYGHSPLYFPSALYPKRKKKFENLLKQVFLQKTKESNRCRKSKRFGRFTNRLFKAT